MAIPAPNIEGHLPSMRQANCMSIDEFLAEAQSTADLNIRPIGTANAKGVKSSLFNNLCQRHGIQPYFTLEEPHPQKFTAKVRLGDHVLENEELFSQKKAAKEALCDKCLKFLESLPDPKKVKDFNGASIPSQTTRIMNKESYKEENYIGLLNTFCQKKSLPAPLYQEYEADCRDRQRQGLSLAARQYSIALTIETIPHIFGGEQALFDSKQIARRHAARDAVLFLRGNGYLDATFSTTKQGAGSNIDGASLAASPASARDGESNFPNVTNVARVADLVFTLGLKPPVYEICPSSPPDGRPLTSVPNAFTSVKASFSPQDADRDARLAGVVAEVTNVYGRKTAKDECARRLIPILEAIKAERMEEVRAARAASGL